MPKPKQDIAPPDPNADFSDVLHWVEFADPKAVQKWFDDNIGDIDKGTLDTLETYWSGAQVTGDLAQRKTLVLERLTQARAFQDLVLKSQAAIIFGKTNNVPPDLDANGDGKVDPLEAKAGDLAQAGALEQVKKAAADKAKAEGATEAQAKAEADATAISFAADGSNVTAPLVSQYTGGSEPTEADKKNLLTAWNFQNPDDQIYDYKALNEIFRTRPHDPFVDSIVQSGLHGDEPIVSYTVKLGTGKDQVVTAQQYKGFNDAFGQAMDGKAGFSAPELTQLIRIADKAGLSDINGQLGWPVLASLVASQRAHVLGAVPTNLGPGAHAGPTSYESGTKVVAGRVPTFLNEATNLAIKYKEGLSMYGDDDALAYLHTMNPGLAARMASTPPRLRSAQDVSSANKYFVAGHFDPGTMAAMDYGISGTQGDTFMSFDRNKGIADIGWNDSADQSVARGKQGQQGQQGQRQTPDPTAVKQSAKDLYRILFAQDPTEAQLAAFVRQVQGTVAGAPENQTVSPDAVLRSKMEGLPEYKQLYGNMPKGMSEQEYRAQFQNGASSMLGNEAPDPSVIQAGLRSGDYQTSIGAAAMSKQAQNNSTFQGRLAQAAQIVSENT